MIPFERLDLHQKEKYEQFLMQSGERGCEYSFANKFLWGRQKAAFLDGFLVFFSQFDRRSVYPFPIGTGELKPVLDKLILDAQQRGIPCYLTGGKYYEKDMCLLGSQAEQYASNINVDIAFFSCAGYSDDGRITDDSESQTAVRICAMKNAKKNILLFDSTKKNMTYAFTVCHKEDVYRMITI